MRRVDCRVQRPKCPVDEGVVCAVTDAVFVPFALDDDGKVGWRVILNHLTRGKLPALRLSLSGVRKNVETVSVKIQVTGHSVVINHLCCVAKQVHHSADVLLCQLGAGLVARLLKRFTSYDAGVGVVMPSQIFENGFPVVAEFSPDFLAADLAADFLPARDV